MNNASDKMSTHTIPANKEEALDAIAALDAARWGEHERDPSRQSYAGKSYGLILNALAHRPEYDFGTTAPHLVAAAKAALTSEDHNWLMSQG